MIGAGRGRTRQENVEGCFRLLIVVSSVLTLTIILNSLVCCRYSAWVAHSSECLRFGANELSTFDEKPPRSRPEADPHEIVELFGR